MTIILWLGVTTPWGTVLKGGNIGTAENHCPRAINSYETKCIVRRHRDQPGPPAHEQETKPESRVRWSYGPGPKVCYCSWQLCNSERSRGSSGVHWDSPPPAQIHQGHYFPGGLEIPRAHKVNTAGYVYIWKALYINRFTNWRKTILCRPIVLFGV